MLSVHAALKVIDLHYNVDVIVILLCIVREHHKKVHRSIEVWLA